MMTTHGFLENTGDGKASEELRDGDRIERDRQLFRLLRSALLGPEPADEPPLPPEEAEQRPGPASLDRSPGGGH